MKLGIDFGTTRIVVAASDRGNFPVITFDDRNGGAMDWYPPLIASVEGSRVYGWEAWAAQETAGSTVVRSVKRFLSDAGPATPVEIDGHRTPLSQILREMAAALYHALRTASNLDCPAAEPLEVMVGVPASGNSNQRFLTLDAFREAGFQVIGLLNEPSAASIEYGHSHGGKQKSKGSILVYDLGGGTFDASLVELDSLAHAVIASEGIPTLGGDDFDAILAELALSMAGFEPAEVDDLTQAEWFRLQEECRGKKESLSPNSRRLLVDLDVVRSGCPPVSVPVADFYARCQPLVDETMHAVADLVQRAAGVESIYVTGGGSELPLVSRMLRERYKTRVKRSPHTRSATAIGLAIQAGAESGFVLRERFTRTFGVWREGDGGEHVYLDPLFAKGTDLPQPGDPPLELKRSYVAVHNVGHFRFIECAQIEAGVPLGAITVWDEIRFPFEPSLCDVQDLSAIPVQHVWRNQNIEERYRCNAGGELEATIANRTAGYERQYKLGRWRQQDAPVVPGRKPRAKR